MKTAKFNLGQVLITPACASVLLEAGKSPEGFLKRHKNNDWGDLCMEDKEANDSALQNGSRILSSYHVGDEKIWIITEAEDDHGVRLATTLLLPSDY